MSKSEIVADYVYIVGHGHSGTTLLELLLAQHPEIVATGEFGSLSLKFARDDSDACSCGMRPQACPVWSQVADAIMQEHGIDIVRHPYRFRISSVSKKEDRGVRSFLYRLLRKYYRLLWLCGCGRSMSLLQRIGSLSLFSGHWARNRLFVASTIRRITGTTAIIDSSKDPFSMVDLYRLHQGNMKVIFITRDIRGNVWSLAKHGTSVSAAARAWSRVNQRTRKCLRHITSSDRTQVKYEDLCAAPANVIRELWAFLGYDHVEGLQQAQFKTWHTIGGNKIRHSALNSIVEDISWQQHLSTEDLELIHHIGGREARILGY